MNQIDLWEGGQQTNRAAKYVVNNKWDSNNRKLISVIAKKPKTLTYKQKKYTLFKVGLINKSLAYPTNESLGKIILDWIKE